MKNTGTRGYALLVVMVGGIVLAALSAALLRNTTSDRSDARVQARTVRALYAAEGGVATGVEKVRTLLDENTEPRLDTVTPPDLFGVTWDEFDVTYVNPNDNFRRAQPCGSDEDCTGAFAGTCSPDSVCRYSFPVTLTEGPYRGLDAMQTPIQVLAMANFQGARATVADIVRLNLVPIFQFAIFFDGDLEFQDPAPMTIGGPTHTNGGVFIKGADRSPLRFESPITAAGYQQICLLAGSEDCMGDEADVLVMGKPLTQGRWSHPSDAVHQAALETDHPEGIKDKTRGIEALALPINVPSSWDVEVTSRPDRCEENSYVPGEQNAAVALVKRPSSDAASEYANPYSSEATSGWSLPYGPAPTTDASEARLHASVGTPPSCTGSPGAAAQAHCQRLGESVPRMTQTETADDENVRGERMYWKAHVRIVDGIWYDKAGNVVFDPEAWSIAGAADVDDARFQRGLRFARVLRYSWFWDPREYRVYAAGNRYQRGEQIRTADFDVYAFRQLLRDDEAVSALFGAEGVPEDGLIVYVSETYDPSATDANAPDDDTGWLAKASNVRNFLNFHTMENVEASATRCFASGKATTPARSNGLTPCALGWHPYYLWGDGAEVLTGDTDLVSLTPQPAAAEDPSYPDLRADAGYRCRNPIGSSGRAELPDYSATPKAPCVEAGASPTGPENAVRLVRATRMPEDRDGDPVGFTFVTDNRLYVYGDVNAASYDAPQIEGRVALMADSISLLSQHFSDRVYQRGGAAGPAYEPRPLIFAFDAQPTSSLPHYGGGLPAGASAGHSPNLCLAWREIDSLRPRRPNVDLAVYASLLMGDVPSCPGDGGDAASGDTSGGVNNFPRFVEDWRGAHRVRIKGSIVNLFRAEQGNSRFLGTSWGESPGASSWTAARTSDPFAYPDDETCVYTPPQRDWSFDEALEDPANLPPGTPRLVTVDRVRWMRR